VRGPFDGIKIDSFFVHIPERGKFAQLRDCSLYVINGVVNILLRGEAPDTEANRTVRELVIST
jgi:hypothetical protein